MIFYCFLQLQTSKSHLSNVRRNVDSWLKDRKIKAFFSVTQDENFYVGAKNCMNLIGIGKKTYFGNFVLTYRQMSIITLSRV